MRTVLAPIATAIVFVATGCTSVKIAVGGAHMERDIQRGIKRQLALSMDVDCPQIDQSASGRIFTCQATSRSGSVFPVEVRQRDRKGNIDWNIGVLAAGPIQTEIERQIRDQKNINVRVYCSDAIDASPGSRFECMASDSAGNKSVIRGTVTDAAGNVSWVV